MESGSKSRWMTKRATRARSGGIAAFASAVYPSVFIFQFGQTVCLRRCAAHERVKHHETEFGHVLARTCPVRRGIGGGAEKCSVGAGSTRPLHPVQKSEILMLNQLNETFLHTPGRLLCVGSHEQVLESPPSRPVTYKSSNMGGPRRQCLPTILSAFAPKK